MKRIFIKLLLSVAPFIIYFFISLTKFTINKNRLEVAYQNEINSYIWVNKVPSVEGYIFGSSSTRYGLSSSIIGDENAHWINFSMDARDPIVFYLLLIKYFSVKHPKYILVGLDPWIYSKKYYFHRNELMYLDLDPLETLFFLQQDKSVLTTKFNERFNLQPQKTEAKNNDTIPEDYGSVKLTKTAINFNVIGNDYFEIYKYHWSDMQFLYLKKIKEFCHQQNVKLIFIIPPKRIDYVNNAHKVFSKEHEQWWKKINAIIGGENIIGSYNTLSLYNQKNIFAEAYHLNQNGQLLFSIYVKDHILNPDIIKPSYSFY